MTPVGILLAAGRGRRFDPSGAHNKLLVRLGDDAVVAAASARALLSTLSHVVAVVPPDDGGVGAVLRTLGCDVTICDVADSGMAASLVRGLWHTTQAEGWIVALGDMPHVLPSTAAALARALEQGADIAVPVHAGRRGNPVAFSRLHLPQLLALEGDQGARVIVRGNPVHEVAVDDPGIHLDIDTLSDLLKNGTLRT